MHLKCIGLNRGVNSSARVALQLASPSLGAEGGDETTIERPKTKTESCLNEIAGGGVD